MQDLQFDLWAVTLDQLRLQMLQSTFDVYLAGTHARHEGSTLIVFASSESTRAWLDSRMRSVIEPSVANVYGPGVTVEFVLNGAEAEPAPAQEAPPAATVEPDDIAQPLTAGQEAADIDFNAAWRKGFSIVSHYASYFWQPYLGHAYLLWKRLEADDRIPSGQRDLRQASNRWSPPLRYHYRPLARAIGRQHPRTIKGGEVECWRSSIARSNGEMLRECCGNFSPVKICPAKNGLLRCVHWQRGLLEILHAEGLVMIDEAQGPRWANRLELQVWRLLPILTPHQVETLNDDLRLEHERWLEGSGDRPHLGRLLGLDLSRWEQIEEHSLVQMIKGYPDHELDGDFSPDAAFLADIITQDGPVELCKPCSIMKQDTDESGDLVP